MSFLTKKYLPRRTFLRGMGVTLALPLLDSMIPAGTALVRTAALPKSRFCGIYIPHGATMDKWTPATEGSGFAFTETLKPLEKLRDRITIVSNLAHPLAGGKGSDAGADHARSAAVFLSGAHPEKGTVHGGRTLDQVLADKVGQDTPLPSIEVCLEEVALNCGAGYGCSYYNTISWRTDTLPLPMENSPQVVFERLFGDGTNAAQRLSRKQQDKSILDSVTDKVARLQGGLDAGDRARLGEYLDNVREIERRIQKATQQSASNPDVPEAPVGVPEAFEDHAKLMFDFMAIAFEADLTRVSAFMLTRELSQRTYPNIGVTQPHHTISHHGNKPDWIEAHAKVNLYHAGLLAKFLERLQKTADGDGSLLDHSLILYGSGMGNGNVHAADHLPTLLVGGGAGSMKGNRHIVPPERTPNGNMLVSVAEKMGVNMDSFGSSTGRVAL